MRGEGRPGGKRSVEAHFSERLERIGVEFPGESHFPQGEKSPIRKHDACVGSIGLVRRSAHGIAEYATRGLCAEPSDQWFC